MAADSQPGNTKYIVLCLGLLIGFVVGFVMLLSSLPINQGVSGYDAYASKPATVQQNSYDFYKYLPGAGERSAPVPDQDSVGNNTPLQMAAVTGTAPAAVEPATRVVPANAQIVKTQDSNATQYAEVPANYTAQQSYFLQAGRFGQHQQAQAMRAQVLLLGLDAFIVTRVEADGATAHRVRVGPYFDQNLLTEAKKRLRRGGINYEIVRVTG